MNLQEIYPRSPFKKKVFYILESLYSISSLHGVGYAHTNLTPNKCIIDKTDMVKLIGFDRGQRLTEENRLKDYDMFTMDFLKSEYLFGLINSFKSKLKYNEDNFEEWLNVVCAMAIPEEKVVVSFPLKRTFITTPPQQFIDNLRNDKNLIQIKYKRGGKIPSEFISSKEAYDKVNIITDLYTEDARIQASVYGNPSPLEYWEKNYEAIQADALKRFGNISALSLRESIYFTTKEATAFSPVISKALYDSLLSPDGGIAFDPFGGWGDRAIGALGSDRVKKYIGVDCNRNLENGYGRILKEIDPQKKLSLSIQTIQDFLLERTDVFPDIIFTSPPYFDFETYTDAKEQSIYGKKSYKEWFNTFIRPVFKDLVRILKKEGYFALHVGPTYRTPTFHDDIYYLLIELGMKYIDKIDCSVGGKRPVPIWVYKK